MQQETDHEIGQHGANESNQNTTSQQQQQQSNSSNQAPGSPRRKKPPLNLDAALYLQSTAISVQEPNSRGGPNSNKASLPPQHHSNRLSPAAQQQKASNCSLSYANRQQPQQQQHSQPQQTGAASKADYSDYSKGASAAYASYSHRNNISVDYIDCVSNNDLAQQPQTMKVIPHLTRKHLRFHRANRIEPNQQSAAAPDAPTPTQPPQSTSSADLQPVDIASNKLDERTGGADLLAGDASSSLGGDSFSTNNYDPAAARLNSSVLYPISVSEVKKRTYFIGSLAQESLLGQDELHRYFPNGRVSIFVCTWNQNRKRAPMNLNDLLLPEQLVYLPDIYAIGIQEAFSSQNDYLKEWEIELQTTLGPNHVLLHSCSLGVLHLSLFIRRDLIWFCSTPEESVYNSRSMPTNMIKTKGAISIAFRFFGTSLMFTNCHFPAHENKLKDRVDEYQRIINSIDLPKNLKLLKPRYLSNDSTARFDCVFFMGDLNFRLEQRTFDETIHILEDIFQQKEPSYEALTQNDELLKVMESNQAFHGFDECQIKFPPTYKFLAQTNKYDRQTKRVPSYTDRILFRSKRQRHIQCLIYDWLPQLLSSDHKPVYCLFDVLIRPGHEQNMVSSLNAGLFQRTVYLEALKRRAEDPDLIRENGAGGSLICTIS